MLKQVEAGQHVQDLKMDILQAIWYIIQAWEEIGADTIVNCWNHTVILPVDADVNLQNLSENIHQTTKSEVDNLCQGLQALHFLDPMQIDEFLNIPEENNIDEVPPMDETIEELICTFKNTPDEVSIDSDMEAPIIKAHTALESMDTICRFLLQQEDAAEHISAIGGIEKYVQEKLADG